MLRTERKRLSEEKNLEVLMAQELYELHSQGAIDPRENETCRYDILDEALVYLRSQIADLAVPFNPSLWYRLLEEAYNINIYILSNDSSKVFDIPKHLHHHVRPLRKESCIILNRIHRYSLAYTQIVKPEIVPPGHDTRLKFGLFPKEMSERCHALLTQ